MLFREQTIKKMALSLSLFMIVLWLVMGTGTSLAWFSDSEEEVNNIFHYADFDVVAEYLDSNGDYQNLEGATEVFDKEALYEPGYNQVVYLRVTNNGTVPLKYKTAVSVVDYTEATGFFGQKFHLQDYLMFGLAVGDSQTELETLLSSREKAEALADMPLNRYETDYAELQPNAMVYIAIVVRMPKEVGNVANYRGDTIPQVELGLIVQASQLDAPDQ